MSAEGDTHRLTLVDAAGRGVRIDRISSHHDIVDVEVDEQVWFFSLVPDTMKRGFGGERPHPRLFHDQPSDADGRVAWSLQLFV